jgi:hypothetical protein
MNPEENLQPAIVAMHRSMVGMEPLPADWDIKVVFADPKVLAYAREEIARLQAVRKFRQNKDHESKIRCEALERLVAYYEETTQ